MVCKWTRYNWSCDTYKATCWNHTPLLLVTPQAANKTMGQGGFQEVEQMNLLKIWFVTKKRLEIQQGWQKF